MPHISRIFLRPNLVRNARIFCPVLIHANCSKDSLTNADAKYLVGWSHGKETLRPGVVDTLKGSYYVNCAFYQSADLSSAPADSFPDFPEYTAPNIWPDKEHLPTFRSTLEELCTLIIDTAILVAQACDRYATAKVSGYKPGYLEHVVKRSMTTKARLLHYFPSPAPPSNPDPNPPNSNESTTPTADDDWCATHLDHGCLTGLTSAMYIAEPSPFPSPHPSSSPALSELPTAPSLQAGLYIRSRTSQIHKISIPSSCLAFQTGEALQLITKGAFRAVPHFVRGAGGKGDNVARNTLAVFTQPNLGEVVDLERGTTFGEFARGVVGRNTA
ncbi:MAG: hypothetical protein Q9160_005009 [Pyrenula sp. 1 TL-2023]